METRSKKYNVSFASRALLHSESLKLAELFLVYRDWAKVRLNVKESNLLQTRTASSSQKLCTEVVQRLRELTEEELTLLVNGTREEQQHVLWVAICKRYMFVFDFAVEVIHEKCLRGDLQLQAEDYARFFHVKAEWHDELSKLNLDMQASVKRTVMRMLREAGLLTKNAVILSPSLSKQFVEALYEDSAKLLLIFPVPEKELRALVGRK